MEKRELKFTSYKFVAISLDRKGDLQIANRSCTSVLLAINLRHIYSEVEYTH